MESVDFVARYLESLHDKKPGTIRQYASDLKQFAEWLDKDIEQVTAVDVVAYADHLTDTGRSSATVKRHVSAVLQLLHFHDVPVSLKGERAHDAPELTEDDFISEHEMAVLLESMQKPAQSEARDVLIPRNVAIVLLMRHHALRPKDISRIVMDDVNLAQSRITLKGETGTIVCQLSEQTANSIRDYLRSIDEKLRPQYHTNHPLFVAYYNKTKTFKYDYERWKPKRLTVRGIQKMMTDEVRRAGLRNVSAKHLRNSCILDQLASGKSDEDICRSVQLTNHLSLRRYKTYREERSSL